ncbi:MAG: histidinol dehydrogenase [Desulfobacteraceae bacterium]|nr:histidinol dehydrogenase [Desulfobacteraceae bacterium]
MRVVTGADILKEKIGFKSNFALQKKVSDIIKNVVSQGDKALFDYTEKFDNVQLQNLRVPKQAIQEAGDNLNPSERELFEHAIENIKRFHKKQLNKTWKDSFDDGTELGQIVRPIERVGIYIPGGTAVYPSSLIMNAVPAQIAGVSSIAVVSPPANISLPHEMVLATCSLLELYEVYNIGGAHSIAALAFGTETIEPVYKITGPGNEYVAEAKRQVFGQVGIDSIAGPSEIIILHDETDVPVKYIVRDMLSQAEHDPKAKSIFITTSVNLAENVANQLEKIAPCLPRKEIIMKSLKNNGLIICINKIEEGIDIVNKIAPEHLELIVKEESIIDQIKNSGAIFVGKWSSEPVGDYLAGPNHVLPTNGTAKYSSPLGVYDFQKYSSFIRYSKERLQKEGRMIVDFAELEQLYAHAAAIEARLEDL